MEFLRVIFWAVLTISKVKCKRSLQILIQLSISSTKSRILCWMIQSQNWMTCQTLVYHSLSTTLHIFKDNSMRIRVVLTIRMPTYQSGKKCRKLKKTLKRSSRRNLNKIISWIFNLNKFLKRAKVLKRSVRRKITKISQLALKMIYRNYSSRLKMYSTPLQKQDKNSLRAALWSSQNKTILVQESKGST